MSYTNESGRRQVLDEMAAAADELSTALAVLGELYERLDEHGAERVEQTVFRPVQSAYGQLKRTYVEFAARHGMPARTLRAGEVGLPTDPRAMLERVADAAQLADTSLGELQDSLLPIEVGDEALRAGLSRTRTLLGPVPAACDALVRTFGR